MTAFSRTHSPVFHSTSSCRADGRLLQPSRPATPLDSTVLSEALDAFASRTTVWFAPSGGDAAPTFGGTAFAFRIEQHAVRFFFFFVPLILLLFYVLAGRTFGTLIAIEVPATFAVHLAELVGLDAGTRYWAIEANTTQPVLVTAQQPLVLSPFASVLDFQVWSFAPVEEHGGWSLLGEYAHKWTAVSAARFTAIAAFDGGILARASGSVGEMVGVAFVSPTGALVRVQCIIGDAETVMIGSDASCSP